MRTLEWEQFWKESKAHEPTLFRVKGEKYSVRIVDLPPSAKKYMANYFKSLYPSSYADALLKG